MAAIIKRKGKLGATYAVQISLGPGRVKKTFGLGKVDKRDADVVGRHIDHLRLRFESGGTIGIPASTASWAASVAGSRLGKQLADAGLIDQVDDGRSTETLAGWLKSYLATRVDVKPATRITFDNAVRNLLNCFDGGRLLVSFTQGDGDAFKAHLLGKEGLSENTHRRRLGLARQMFEAAVRSRLIAENPLGHIKGVGVTGNEGKLRYVTGSEYLSIIDACPDAEWRCIVALARIGGIRVPSELLPLKWSDIDWADGRIRITSPKTARKGKGSRIIPLFPAIETELREAWILAGEGSEYVVSRYRSPSVNLRTQFKKIIKRAGIEPWDKLFHNCRASRAIDLAREYPSKTCEKWMGHTSAIAAKHYLTVTDDDWERARAADSLATSCANPPKSRNVRIDAQEKTAIAGQHAVSGSRTVVNDGRYWTRTNDLFGVNEAL